MNKLFDWEIETLKFIEGGGLIAVAIHGKRSMTVEIVCKPKFTAIGLRRVGQMEEAGLVKEGDPSPYKSGQCRPLVLTDAGKAALAAPHDSEAATGKR